MEFESYKYYTNELDDGETILTLHEDEKLNSLEEYLDIIDYYTFVDYNQCYYDNSLTLKLLGRPYYTDNNRDKPGVYCFEYIIVDTNYNEYYNETFTYKITGTIIIDADNKKIYRTENDKYNDDDDYDYEIDKYLSIYFHNIFS